jgi:hypothetical protein
MTDSQGFSPNAMRILKARYFMKNAKGEFLDKAPSDGARFGPGRSSPR